MTRCLQRRLLLALACGLCADSASAESVRIDPSMRYQTMQGFGASLTESSATLINGKLNATQRATLMTNLFSPTTGIGLSFLRQPMGASDYATSVYSLDEVPAGQTDYNLTSFSVAREQATIVPLLQQAKALNPSLQLMATPWSAPAWMKTNGLAAGGKLIDNASVYNAYANYFVKYAQAYAAQGLPISYFSMQNEPWLETAYPSMKLEPAEAARLIKLVGPRLQAAGIDAKILAWDFNWENASAYLTPLLADASAAAYIDGIAFHGYSGDVSAQNTIRTQFPSKNIYFTELTATLGSNFGDDLMWDMKNLIVGATRNHAATVVRWNLALDQNGAPFYTGGSSLCRGMVTINSNTSAVTYNEEYYSIGHLSRFVKVGAQRVASDSDHSAAFVNPDGSTAVVQYNDATASTPVVLRWKGQQLKYTLPARSAATFTWVDPAVVQVWMTTANQSKLLARQADVSFGVTQWNVNRVGDWFNEANWTISVPNGVDDAAVLGPVNTAPRTVYADAPLTLGRLRFDSDVTYALAGAANLTLKSSVDPSRIEVLRGVHLLNLPTTIASPTTIDVATGAALTIADPVTVLAGQSLTQAGAGQVRFISRLTLQDGATMTLAESARTREPVAIDGLSLATSASLDIGIAPLVLRDAMPTNIQNLVDVGRIVSRSAGVIVLNADGIGLPLSVAARPGDVLVIAAIPGDVDLDGAVTALDLRLIQANLGTEAPGSNGWRLGDVTQDGRVDPADRALAAGNMGRSLLPEPATGVLFIAQSFLLGRRRQATAGSEMS
ncbi:MAG: glycoside hydrolase family 30 beta sandwich domain-containing protein [Tepidisphaeraceae bacterium]